VGASPQIGILTAQHVSPAFGGLTLYGQGADYIRAVALAGGAPVLIPLGIGEAAWRAIYDRLDGLLLPGGVDVDPAQYGEAPMEALGRVDEALDRAELLLARWALDDGMPVFGVCRGIQVINVAARGTLYQDLPTQCPGTVPHACNPPAYPRGVRVHAVSVTAGSRLARAMGDGSCKVNSRHHQAVKDLAPGFVVSARASDGVIEGIERPTGAPVYGVQWHPENLAADDSRMLALFELLVDAARQ
jgi:putative glutamine amidotransferase